MTSKEKYWKYSLIILIVLLGGVIVKELWTFVNGLLGAFTLFVLVRKQMIYLTEKKCLHKVLAAVLILLEIATVIILPIYFVSWILIAKVQNVNLDLTGLVEVIKHFDSLIQAKIGYNFFSVDNLTKVTSFLTKAVQLLINQASGFVITSVVMIFLLYFMLVGYKGIERYVYELLPFNEQNRKDVMHEIYVMVKSNAIGIPLLAIIQGIVAYIGYLIFDVPSSFVFALLTCFSTIIPIVGTGLVWAPLVIYFMLNGDWFNAIGLAIYSGVVLTNVDNVIRFILQKKLADTHPLITVFGVILGLNIFGFWGVIFGPLLLSLFFLLINIFKREYLDKDQ